MSEASISIPTLSLLVIDAERTFHAIVQAAAASLPGAQVICCTSPGEAINRLDSFTPAMIIIEGRLGGAAAINFVRRLRAGQTPAPAGTLVMFVSQDFSGGLSGKLCEVGCHALVRKPVSPDALARAFVRVFGNPVPFVLGGRYLGPDRRHAGAAGQHEPERRRMPTLGGWGAAPRPAGATFPVVTTTTAGAASGRPKLSGTPIETAGGKVKSAGGAIEMAVSEPGPVKASGMAIEPAASPPAKRVASEPIETPVTRARPQEDYDLAPPAQTKSEASKEPEFDVAAVVELHRQWIMSNGKSGARAILAGKPLVGAALSGTNLAKADFRGADLTNADLRNCILVDADLRNASLAQATVNESQLAGAKIRHADLQFAQFVQCGLQGSDLAGADLRGADLNGINLTQKQLDRAKGDHTTQLPPGLFVSMDELS